MVLCDRLPLVPVTVSVEVPDGVEALVATVMVEEPGAVVEAGLKLAVAPEGRPLALKEMLPLKALIFPRFTV